MGCGGEVYAVTASTHGGYRWGRVGDVTGSCASAWYVEAGAAALLARWACIASGRRTESAEASSTRAPVHGMAGVARGALVGLRATRSPPRRAAGLRIQRRGRLARDDAGAVHAYVQVHVQRQREAGGLLRLAERRQVAGVVDQRRTAHPPVGQHRVDPAPPARAAGPVPHQEVSGPRTAPDRWPGRWRETRRSVRSRQLQNDDDESQRIDPRKAAIYMGPSGSSKIATGSIVSSWLKKDKSRRIAAL